MLTCSTEHRGREDTDLRGNLQGPWRKRAQAHPPMHMELVGLYNYIVSHFRLLCNHKWRNSLVT